MAENADPEEWQGISPEAVAEHAKVIGLLDAAPSRVSYLMMVQLYLEPDIAARVVDEIKTLEGVRPSYGTKGLEPFEKPPLRGLMKKHYLPQAAGSVPQNIKNEVAVQRKRLDAFIADHTQNLMQEHTVE